MKSQSFRTAAGLGSALFFLFSGAASAATVTVHVGAGGTGSQVKNDGYGYMDPVLIFAPAFVSIQQGDTVQWIWDADTHSTTSGSSGFWNSGVLNDGAIFTHVPTPEPLHIIAASTAVVAG